MPERFSYRENKAAAQPFGWATAYEIGEAEAGVGIAIVPSENKAKLIVRLLNRHSDEIKVAEKPASA